MFIPALFSYPKPLLRRVNMPPKNIYRSRKVVSCKYCFYEKNDECQLRVCPYVAERITAKVINYEKLILEFFKGNQPRLFSTRLRKHCRTYRHFSYLSTSHRKLFEQTRDEIVQRIFSEYLNGKTSRTIARELNAECPRNRPWRRELIEYILKNERYAGKGMRRRRKGR